MEMLWPSVPSKHARHSLAQAVTVIKSKVGRERVVAARSSISLAAGSVDVDALSVESNGPDVGGAFLDGFDIPGARGFDQWKDEWTSKLLPRIRDSLVRHMDAARRLGDFPTVERHATTLLQFDPLSEDGVRGVMEARAWVGDRSGALKTYESYIAQLAEILDAQPSPDMIRMATLLREGHQPRRPNAVAEPYSRRERRMEAETIIGRTREFSLLFDNWLDVKKSAPRVVIVTGDPGIGKTTLTNAFLSSCQLEGAVVARVQAYDAERELPFAVLSELVRQLVLQRTIGGADPEALAELGRVCTDVGAVFPGVPKPPEWAAEVIPIRLSDALLKSVTAAAEDRPVVLVIDDVHAADNSSSAILHMLARRLGRARFMLLLAGRSSELRQAGAGALVGDSNIPGLSTIEVGPLTVEASRELVCRIVESPTHRDAPVDRIVEAGRGNALALELLAREWVDHGPESLLRDLEAINTTPPARIGIPPAVRSVFDREVRRLDPSVRAVLDFAAVLGRRLHEVELYQTAGITPIAASNALSRLMEEGFLREVQGGIEFRNELIRAQAYYAIPGPGREHLHRAAGEALVAAPERVGADLEIAWHFIRGRALGRATELALQGAERCLERGAPQEAEQVLETVLSGSPSEHRRLLMLLAQALLDQSKGEEATPHLDVLWASPSLSGGDRARIAAMRATAEYILARETGVRHCQAAEEALSAARNAGDPPLVAKALNVLARAHGETGDAKGLEGVGRIIANLLQSPEYRSLPMIHYTAGYCEYARGEAMQAREHVDRALELAHVSARPTDVIPLLNGLAVAHHHGGNAPAAQECFERALDLARRIGDDSWSCTVATNLCGILLNQGRAEAAISFGKQAAELAQRALTQPRSVMTYTNLANAYLLLGDRKEVVQWLARAEAMVGGASNWEPLIILHTERASIRLALGDVEAALESIGTLEALAGQFLFGPHWGALERLRAFRTAHFGDPLSALRGAISARARFKGRTTLYYMSVNAAVAWLEKRLFGGIGVETKEGLELLDNLGFTGTKTFLRMEGFVD
ncbi:MAG TPA: AAA family ATPase [Gemmatimonadales bacterium]|nr:AAA family ATPase [Gemmatimonadales bacterium]